MNIITSKCAYTHYRLGNGDAYMICYLIDDDGHCKKVSPIQFRNTNVFDKTQLDGYSQLLHDQIKRDNLSFQKKIDFEQFKRSNHLNNARLAYYGYFEFTGKA